LLPSKIIGGATSTYSSPNFFCNLHLKVTCCKCTFNTLENSPVSGALPQTPLYTAYTFCEKNTYCIKLYFEFGCFSPIFAPPNDKLFPRVRSFCATRITYKILMNNAIDLSMSTVCFEFNKDSSLLDHSAC